VQEKVVHFLIAAMLVTLAASGLAVAFAGRTLEKYREPRHVLLEDVERGGRAPSVHLELDERSRLTGSS